LAAWSRSAKDGLLYKPIYLDGLVIDWVQTPQGPGFGIYAMNLQKLEMRMGAD
jgi:hypothetical protein